MNIFNELNHKLHLFENKYGFPPDQIMIGQNKYQELMREVEPISVPIPTLPQTERKFNGVHVSVLHGEAFSDIIALEGRGFYL